MPGDAKWELNINTEDAKAKAHAAILQGVQQVFEIEIKTDAVEESPYLTGTNRRSIDTEVTETPHGVNAQIFTQSGYGGYLELGTYKMRAQPYMFPAFNRHIKDLTKIIGVKIRAITPSMFRGKKG